MKSRFKTQTKTTVRFSDTDAMGHVNNARYFSYMEDGRVFYFKNLFPDADLKNAFDIFPFILADMKITFKSPAFCGETLITSLGITKIGNKSFVMEYDIIEETTERLVATGESVLVMYDYKTQSTIKIPEEFRQKISLE